MKILLIDDDSFFRNFYATKLTESGYQVDTAMDGEEGLFKMQQQKPDLILLDLIMPKKDGFEVLTVLNTNPILKSIPVMVFSTLGQEQDTQKAQQLGAKNFINKGYIDFNELVKKIEAFKSG